MTANRPFMAMEPSVADRAARLESAHKRVSNAVAYGLMVYTALQIFLTMRALEEADNTLLPMIALVVLVGEHDQVENRIIDLPAGITSSQLTEAANFLNAHMIGHTLPELRGQLQKLRIAVSNELDALSQDLVERGLAVWSGGSDEDMPARLIVRGRANLLEGLAGAEDVDRLRLLFDDLEKKDSLIELLNLAETGSGVRIFIGSENKLFSLSGSSLIVAPYRDEDDRIVGAVGVIGPTRLNYARIVPMVDYTAQIMGRLSRQRP